MTTTPATQALLPVTPEDFKEAARQLGYPPDITRDDVRYWDGGVKLAEVDQRAKDLARHRQDHSLPGDVLRAAFDAGCEAGIKSYGGGNVRANWDIKWREYVAALTPSALSGDVGMGATTKGPWRVGQPDMHRIHPDWRDENGNVLSECYHRNGHPLTIATFANVDDAYFVVGLVNAGAPAPSPSGNIRDAAKRALVILERNLHRQTEKCDDAVNILRAALTPSAMSTDWAASGIPDEAIEAGIEAWQAANHEMTARELSTTPEDMRDWDDGMIVAAIFKAVTRAMSGASALSGDADIARDLQLARLGDYPGAAGVKRMAAAIDAMSGDAGGK